MTVSVLVVVVEGSEVLQSESRKTYRSLVVWDWSFGSCVSPAEHNSFRSLIHVHYASGVCGGEDEDRRRNKYKKNKKRPDVTHPKPFFICYGLFLMDLTPFFLSFYM